MLSKCVMLDLQINRKGQTPPTCFSPPFTSSKAPSPPRALKEKVNYRSSCQQFFHPLKIMYGNRVDSWKSDQRDSEKVFSLIELMTIIFQLCAASLTKVITKETSAQERSTQHSRFAPSPLGRRVLTVAQGGEVHLAANVRGLHNPGKKKIEN